MKKIFTLFAAVLMTVSAMAKWDGTVTLSKTSISSLSDLEGITLTLPGATSVQVVDAEDMGGLVISSQDETKNYAVWNAGYNDPMYAEYFPGVNCTISVTGNQITIGGWWSTSVEGMPLAPLPTEAATLHLLDNAIVIVDGEYVYLNDENDIEIAYNPGSITPDPEPEPTPLTVTLTVAEDNSKLTVAVDDQTLPYAVAVYSAADYAEYSAAYDDLKLIQLFISGSGGKTVLQGNQEITVADAQAMGLLVDPGTYQILACGLTEDFDQNGDIAKATITINNPAAALESATLNQVTKTFINGQLVIIRDGIEYNALGAQL